MTLTPTQHMLGGARAWRARQAKEVAGRVLLCMGGGAQMLPSPFSSPQPCPSDPPCFAVHAVVKVYIDSNVDEVVNGPDMWDVPQPLRDRWVSPQWAGAWEGGGAHDD